MAQCVECGAEFIQRRGKGQQAVCCSTACKVSRRRNLRVKVKIVCGHCQQAATVAEKGGIYCSRQCKDASQVTVADAICKQCDQVFRPRQRDYSTYCSRECAFAQWKAESAATGLLRTALLRFRQSIHAIARAGSRRRKANQRVAIKAAKTVGECEVCQSKFDRPDAKMRQCIECRADRIKVEKRQNKAKRKEQIRLAMTDWERSKLKTRAIWNRDAYCYLCGVQTVIGSEHDSTAPNYANADHLMPLSRGGKHNQDNLRIACRACNLAKSDLTAEEFNLLPAEERDMRRERFMGKATVTNG